MASRDPPETASVTILATGAPRSSSGPARPWRGPGGLARRPNYGSARRQKALDRQARQQAKRQWKTTRAESGAQGLGMGEAQDAT
jgi:hypothetical protein